jgi:hypothetical protein
VTTLSCRIVKSSIENNQLQAAVYDEIEAVNLNENKNVKVGETQVVIRTYKLQEQKVSYQRNLSESTAFKEDIKA